MKSPMQFNDAAIIDDLWMEVISSMPITQMNGLSVVVDCKGLGSFIFKWLIPKNCKVSSSKMDVFPIRDWTIHLVNMGPILKTCVALVKPFLSKTAVAKVSEQVITSIFSGQRRKNRATKFSIAVSATYQWA